MLATSIWLLRHLGPHHSRWTPLNKFGVTLSIFGVKLMSSQWMSKFTYTPRRYKWQIAVTAIQPLSFEADIPTEQLDHLTNEDIASKGRRSFRLGQTSCPANQIRPSHDLAFTPQCCRVTGLRYSKTSQGNKQHIKQSSTCK